MITFNLLNDLAPDSGNKQQAPSDKPETWSAVSGQWPESSPTLLSLAHQDIRYLRSMITFKKQQAASSKLQATSYKQLAAARGGPLETGNQKLETGFQ
jgi:hypothetical protein